MKPDPGRRPAAGGTPAGTDAILDLHPKWMRYLLDLPFVGVAIYDARRRRWARFNERFCATVGYSRRELSRMSWRDLCHPEDRAECERAFRRLNARTRHTRVVYRFLHKDGRVVHAEIDFSFARAAAKPDDFVIALVSDVAEHRAASAEEKLRAVVEQTITGFYMLEDGRFTYVNPRMAEIFGYSIAEMTGIAATEVVAPEERALVAENIRRRIDGEVDNLRFDVRGLRKDGSLIDVGVHGSATTIHGRRAIVGLVQDITERRKAEKKIKEYVRRLESAMVGTVEAISRMVDLRDPYTSGHERRVAEIAGEIGRGVGLEEERVRGLQIAGRLHDIGKISVPAEILSKPTRLTSMEYEIVKLHACHGHEILEGVEFPWPVAEIAHQHHERMDGSGYPHGLKGDAIIPEARILAVADVIEAMSSHRPYRASLGIESALAEIERGAGRLYDGNAANAALRLFREKGYRLQD